jgi:hypothetical protein
MGGAGRKPVVGSYRTERVTYRSVDTADTDVDAIEETIDTRYDRNSDQTMTVTTGADSMLALYVLLAGPSAATIQVYAKASDEDQEDSGSSSSPAGTSEWAFYVEKSVDSKNLLHVMWPLPAGIYKVMVTSITGSGDVIIRESHSA